MSEQSVIEAYKRELASNPELHQNPGYGAGTSTEE